MNEQMTFLPKARILTLEEMALIGRAFVELGVTKLRITGGEPLVRQNVLSLFAELGKLPGLKELTLTTNGSQLARHAAALREAVNVPIIAKLTPALRRPGRGGRRCWSPTWTASPASTASAPA